MCVCVFVTQLLLLDNHSTHIKVEVLEKARQNNVEFLALPSHTSHVLQPLDRCPFGSLQGHYRDTSGAARMLKPGHTLALTDFPAIFRDAFYRAMTPANITAGFRLAGVWPPKKPEFKTEPSSVYVEIPRKQKDQEKDEKENDEATSSVVEIEEKR